MKAIVYEKYGSPDDLYLREVEKPVPKDGEVLVKVHAASINSWDWDNLRGTPFLSRVVSGLLKPKYPILGADIAGQVEAAGANVNRLHPGDEVFGDISGCSWGGFAEHVCAREDVLAPKPASLTFEEAAAVPQAAVLALQGLRYEGQVQPGQKILINGAGGGVGTFAVQIAKSFGAEVTGVDSLEKLDMLRSLGADHVIDYTQEDFTRNGQGYDLILDVVATRSVFDYKRALNSNGVYVFVGGSGFTLLQALFLGPFVSRSKGSKMSLLLHKPSADDLVILTEWIEAGKVNPVIDRRYSLSEVPEAFRYFGEGRHRGKIVITI